MSTKPALPQGTRDFLPLTLRRRQYILSILKEIFERYGFAPIETPALENLSTLTGKYGEEGDRLIFKVLNNGLHEKKNKDALRTDWERLLDAPVSLSSITERALRYDLTIPFARFVVQHQQHLAWPFRRYQMQPVWRADRPQKGRYREFWQCDADVVGSPSLLNEAELLCIYQDAFYQLKIPAVSIKINSRKILAALAEACGSPEKLTDITVALDKLDKIGWDGVEKELQEKGLGNEAISIVQKLTTITGSSEEKLEHIATLLSNTEMAQAGIQEITETLRYHKAIANVEWPSEVVIDFSLARGLNYYTGLIVEVSTTAVQIGSIGGGGRYDDLTGLFGLKNLTGIGISFGIDRIYDVMEELSLFPEKTVAGTQVLILSAGEATEDFALNTLCTLRNAGVATELYPDRAKLDKQMKYADKRGIPFVIIIGEEEVATKMLTIKNMGTGEQVKVGVEGVVEFLGNV